MNKDDLKSLFTFSKKEKNGTIILITIIFLLLLIMNFAPRFISNNKNINYKQYKAEIENFKNSLHTASPSAKTSYNTSKKTASSYNQTHEQKNKTNNTSSKQNKSFTYRENHNMSNPVKPVKIIGLNTADTTALKKIPGIGPVFSARIIKYRELLGGFAHIRQLQEVYGINDTIYNNIKKFLTLDTIHIKKICINDVTFKQLLKHPYIDYYQTKAVFNYKNLNGQINNLNEIKKNNLIDTGSFIKLKPYLTIE